MRRPWWDGPADLRAVEYLVLLQRTVALEEEGLLEFAAVAGPLAAVVAPAAATTAHRPGVLPPGPARRPPAGRQVGRCSGLGCRPLSHVGRLITC
ncbi:hypothetical protein ACWEQ8_13385 [Streptomyces noursei]